MAFTGTLTDDAPGFQGFCVVQQLSRNLLTAGGTQVRIVLRGSTTGSLTLDKVTISQPDAAVTSDPFDAAADLTDVASGVTIPPNTAVTVPPNGPVNYTLEIPPRTCSSPSTSATRPAKATCASPRRAR